MEKKIDIKWEGKPETVTIKRLTFGDSLNLRKECRKITTVAGQTRAEIDEKKLAVESFKVAIVKAPFPLNEQSILDLDKMLAEKIEKAIDEFNSLDEGKKNGTTKCD